MDDHKGDLSVDGAERQITLSLKAVEGSDDGAFVRYDENRLRNAQKPPSVLVSSQGRSGATLGDVLKDKLGDKLTELSKN